jgi:hypothetical protein
MTHDELLRIERELGDGPGDAYRRHLTDDAWRVVLHQQTPEP